jgi:hypothetical protein
MIETIDNTIHAMQPIFDVVTWVIWYDFLLNLVT